MLPCTAAYTAFLIYRGKNYKPATTGVWAFEVAQFGGFGSGIAEPAAAYANVSVRWPLLLFSFFFTRYADLATLGDYIPTADAALSISHITPPPNSKGLADLLPVSVQATSAH